jgi:TctA family transporter
MVEENFRRALLLSRGDMAIFITRPISAGFVYASLLLVGVQVISFVWKKYRKPKPKPAAMVAEQQIEEKTKAYAE